MKVKIDDAYLILIYYLEEIEREGWTIAMASFSFDDLELTKINERFIVNYSMDEWVRAFNKCISSNWLRYRYIASKNLQGLELTDEGLGIARSKRKELTELEARTVLMKISDWSQRHSGLIALLALVISIIALFK